MNIIVLGGGLRIPDQITIETLEMLSTCKAIFTVYHPKKLVESTIEWYIDITCKKNIDIQVFGADELYKPNTLRENNYELVAKTIIQGVAKFGSPVCYFTQGNPVNYDRVTSLLSEYASKNKYDFVIFPAISSIDTIMVDLQQEIAPGIQIYESSCFVGQDIKPDIRYSCLLLQISSFGTSYILKNRQVGHNSLILLKNYLLKFYPENHIVTLVKSKTNTESIPRMKSVILKKLGEEKLNELIGASLYIPPVNTPLMNQSFANKMTDLKHLNDMHPEK